jgi:hypothetical protein
MFALSGQLQPATRPAALLLCGAVCCVITACDPTTSGADAPPAAGTYALSLLKEHALPVAHRQEQCASTENVLGPRMAFDSVISGFLRLDPERTRPLLGGPPAEQLRRFALVWRVRTTAPEPGQPVEWDCFQGVGLWWEEPRGTIQLYHQFCALVACDPAKREELVASSIRFERGTTLQSTLFNGGVTGTFIRR